MFAKDICTLKLEIMRIRTDPLIYEVHPATYLFNVCYILNVATLTER